MPNAIRLPTTLAALLLSLSLAGVAAAQQAGSRGGNHDPGRCAHCGEDEPLPEYEIVKSHWRGAE